MDYFNVIFDNHQAGTVTVERVGLYVKIYCVLFKEYSGFYRLIMHTKSNELDLGVCISYENSLGLNTKIAQKYVEDGIFSFTLKQNDKKENNIYVETDKSFSKLENVDRARYVFRNHSGFLHFL